MTQPANHDPIARARILAADYQANPTPARAHNAAQVLWDVLGTLDAVVARTFAITDENTRLQAIANLPAPICFADGPQLGANTLTCYLAQNHEGDHSTNAHPNPRTWPQLATGGIVDSAATTRIGENS